MYEFFNGEGSAVFCVSFFRMYEFFGRVLMYKICRFIVFCSRSNEN